MLYMFDSMLITADYMLLYFFFFLSLFSALTLGGRLPPRYLYWSLIFSLRLSLLVDLIVSSFDSSIAGWCAEVLTSHDESLWVGWRCPGNRLVISFVLWNCWFVFVLLCFLFIPVTKYLFVNNIHIYRTIRIIHIAENSLTMRFCIWNGSASKIIASIHWNTHFDNYIFKRWPFSSFCFLFILLNHQIYLFEELMQYVICLFLKHQKIRNKEMWQGSVRVAQSSSCKGRWPSLQILKEKWKGLMMFPVCKDLNIIYVLFIMLIIFI